MIIELESRILGLKRTELLQFGEEMKWISAEEIGEKGRLDLIRIIRTVFEEEIQKGDSEQLRSLLEKIQSVLDGKSTTQSEENTNAKEKNVEELKQLQTQFENLLVQQEELKNKITSMQSQTDTVESTTAKLPKQQDDQQDTYNLKTSMLRREFKIQGQIGEPGQKDKLAYQSLISQIEIGLGKGYTEEEVTNAVVRSIQAGLQLRSYLEGLAGLTLPRLRKILRFHFQEKSATELYQLLTNISQAQKESPQEFLIRALTIRQKIVFASKEADSKIKYDEQLVQGLFLHALETGLLDETIRAKMRPLLKNDQVADEELIEAMSTAMAAESERATKFNLTGRGKPTSKISKIEAGTPPKPVEAVGKFESEMLATMKTIQAELNTVQSEVASLRTKVDQKDLATPPRLPLNSPVGDQGKQEDYYRGNDYPMCKTCQDENRVRCPHCFKCGGRNHLARHCRSGNEKRLPKRD